MPPFAWTNGLLYGSHIRFYTQYLKVMCIISYLTVGIETDTLERNERERIRTAFHRTRGAGTRGTDEAA